MTAIQLIEELKKYDPNIDLVLPMGVRFYDIESLSILKLSRQGEDGEYKYTIGDQGKNVLTINVL